MTVSAQRIGLGWPLQTGRGHLDLVIQWLRKGLHPTLLSGASELTLDPLRQRMLQPLLQEHAANRTAFERNRGRRLPFPVLHALGDRLVIPPSADDTPGRPDIGIACFTHTDFAAEHLQRAVGWPLIVTGSMWAARVLQSHGLRNAVHIPPGIDPSVFHSAPAAGLFPDRFVVFSGGRLGYSQGQDVLVTAFVAFHARHPDALLLCAWEPGTPAELRGLAGVPDAATGMVRAAPWLARHGVPADAVIDAGPVQEPARLAALLRECSLAVFPGRCAGNAPVLAMQAMACGVPTALAANTGHMDLIGNHTYVLKQQADVVTAEGTRATEGWGTCSVEELLATMERAYDRRAEAAGKGQAAARFVAGWTCEREADRWLNAIERAAAGLPVPAATTADDYRWGHGLHRAGRLAEAEQVYGTVLQREPGHVAAWLNRGHARRDRGEALGAKADFRAALALQPGHPQALQCLGNLLRDSGQLSDAIDHLRQAAAHAETPSIHWDLAFTLLLAGRYAEAWPHFDRRHAALGLRTAHHTKPRWQGEPVTDGTLLVLDEQGLGDTMQFVRFLPRIPVGTGGRVIFAGKRATLSVVRRLMPQDDVFDWDQPLPRSTMWVPLMSLSQHLGIASPEHLPPPAPARLAEPERVARWRPLVRGTGDQPVVALCWRGNPYFPGDALRSPGLAVLRPLLDVTGLRFVSMQVGPARGEMAELERTASLADVGGAIEASGADALDTLAALESCDFVISPCTSVAHMTGLVGRPGRVLVSHRPDWRWMLERPDTPWYPSLRLIRQPALGDWAAVAREAANHLAAWRDTGRPDVTGR